VMPAAVVIAILVYSLMASTSLRATEDSFSVRITGQRWWWHVEYSDDRVVTANELYIPTGTPVRLELTSADLVHSLWVPNLRGKLDLIPARVNEMRLLAERPGTYLGQCAEYCGAQHAHMDLKVVALEPAEFEAWLAARREPPPLPTAGLERRGYELFFEAGCQQCHAISGTRARARNGPDLTRIGSRSTLGAGAAQNDERNLADWIRDPQKLKRGNLMPSSTLGDEDLRALVAYLKTLK
jgi:cytochrome c oxidase subunit II